MRLLSSLGLLAFSSALAAASEPVRSIRVAAVVDPPFVLPDATSPIGYSGIMASAVEGVFEALNNDIRTNSTTYEPDFIFFDNYTAAFQALLSGQADMSGMAVTSALIPATPGTPPPIVFSTPVFTMSLVMATNEEAEHPHYWVVLQPFTFASWLVFVAWIFAFALVFFVADRLSPLGTSGHGMPLPPYLSLWGLFGAPDRKLLPSSADVAEIEKEEEVNRKIEQAHRGSISAGALEALDEDDFVDAVEGAAGGDADAGVDPKSQALVIKNPFQHAVTGGASPATAKKHVGVAIEGAGDLEHGHSASAHSKADQGHGHAYGHAHEHGHDEGHGGHGATQLVPLLFDTTVGALEFEYERHFPRPTSYRFLFVFFRILCFFLLALYESSLNAIEVSLETQSNGLTLAEVQQQQLPWGTLATSVDRFTASTQFGLRQMAMSGAMNTYQTTEDLVSALQNKEVDAIFRLDAVLRYWGAKDTQCDLELDLTAAVSKVQIAIAMPSTVKSTAFLAVTNEAITRMQLAQEFTEVAENVISNAGGCGAEILNPVLAPQDSQIHLSSLIGAYVVAGAVLALGWIVHIAEWCLHWGCLKPCGLPRASSRRRSLRASESGRGSSTVKGIAATSPPPPSRGDRVVAMGSSTVVVPSTAVPNPLATSGII